MKKRMMVLLLAAAMGMAMAGCQYGGDADAKSEQEETKKEGTKKVRGEVRSVWDRDPCGGSFPRVCI